NMLTNEDKYIRLEPIYKNIFVHKNASIGENCKFGFNIVIDDKVEIGDNCYFGNNVSIKEGVLLGDGIEIQDNVVIGKQPRSSPISSRKASRELLIAKIGNETLIGTGSVVYGGTNIGNRCFIGDLASIREKCKIHDLVIIGRAVTIEYETEIMSHTKIQTACHLTGNLTIGRYVFFGPEVCTLNDKYMDTMKYNYKGATVKDGATVGSNASLLSAITIGIDAVIGAGAVVTKDVPDRQVWVGNPAKYIKDVPQERWLENRVKNL
ncbi:MAG: DapH/DapD/GlmU-related protein, partial [Candidatus Hermodarchaeota archaeon]